MLEASPADQVLQQGRRWIEGGVALRPCQLHVLCHFRRVTHFECEESHLGMLSCSLCRQRERPYRKPKWMLACTGQSQSQFCLTPTALTCEARRASTKSENLHNMLAKQIDRRSGSVKTCTVEWKIRPESCKPSPLRTFTFKAQLPTAQEALMTNGGNLCPRRHHLNLLLEGPAASCAALRSGHRLCRDG